MTDYLDHILWGCDDLERGCSQFADMTGIKPQYGGVHASGATHNAIAGIGGRRYIEILAPTRAPRSDTDELARLARGAREPRVLTYCMRSALPLSDIAVRAKARGWKNAEVSSNGRTMPDGMALRWQWLVPKIEAFGLAFPFFIDWLDSIHPAEAPVRADGALFLRRFSVGHPRNTELRAVLVELGSPVDTFQADAIQFRAIVDCPRGVITLN